MTGRREKNAMTPLVGVMILYSGIICIYFEKPRKIGLSPARLHRSRHNRAKKIVIWSHLESNYVRRTDKSRLPRADVNCTSVRNWERAVHRNGRSTTRAGNYKFLLTFRRRVFVGGTAKKMCSRWEGVWRRESDEKGEGKEARETESRAEERRGEGGKGGENESYSIRHFQLH